MLKNQRGRPKKQQQKQQNVIVNNRSITLRNSKQKDKQGTIPQYDKIMAQIKETYASLNEANLQKQQFSDLPKRLKKLDKGNKKMKPNIQSNKKSESIQEKIKKESQDLQEHVEQIKSKFQQIFKNFAENIKIEIVKTEQEMLKILK